MVRVNRPYRVPETLDLDDLLVFDADAEIRENKYHLHCVVIHQGDADGGHYYTFIKKDCHCHKWFEFNDEEVIPRDLEYVLEEAIGKPYKTFFVKNLQDLYEKWEDNDASAYMLIYVRDTE